MNKIENSKTTFFKDKEHYLKFRKQWKDYYNSKMYIRQIPPTEGQNKKTIRWSELKIEHHLFYNLLRGKAIESCFVLSEKKNTKAIIRNALWVLHRQISHPDQYRKGNAHGNVYIYDIFVDTLTDDMLEKLKPELDRLYKLYL